MNAAYPLLIQEDVAQLQAAEVFIHLPLIRREEEWRDGTGRGVRRQGDQ